MSLIPDQLHSFLEEFRSRLERTLTCMECHRLDALLLHQPENVAWLSGFGHDRFFALHSLVVPAHNDPIVVERVRKDLAVEEFSWVVDRNRYLDGEDPEALAATTVKHMISDRSGWT